MVMTEPFLYEISHQENLQTLFDVYISESKYSKRLRPQTIKGYQEVFQTFQKIVPEVKSVSELTARSVAEFFRRVSIRKRKIGDETRVGIKASTTDTYYRKLMVFFRWLENNEYVPIGSLSEKVQKVNTPKGYDLKLSKGTKRFFKHFKK